jgi:recombination protein RecA
MEAEEDDPGRIGEQARIMSRFLSMIGKYISDYKVCVLFINQLRSVIKASKYDTGPLEETSGGRSLKYYCSVRIKMKKGKIDYTKTISRITGKSEDKPNNINVKVTIIKNKIDAPYFSGPIFIKFGEGFDNITSIIDLADNCGVIKKSGAYYRFDSGDQTLFNVSGRENLRDFLEKNQSILDTLSSCVKLKVDEEEKAEGVKEIQDIPENEDVENILDQVKKNLDKAAPEELELKDPAKPEKAALKGKKNAKG